MAKKKTPRYQNLSRNKKITMLQRFSPQYLDQLQQVHRSRDWGFFNFDLNRIKKIYDDYDCKSVLDYGCGRGIFSQRFFQDFGISVENYDPGRTEYFQEPKPADLVVCTDVLEHVEPEYLDTVLAHLSSLTKKVSIISISFEPAKGNLPDGRNMHLIVKPPDWWHATIKQYFYFDWAGRGTWLAVPKV